MKKMKTLGKSLISFLIISFCFIILGLLALQSGEEFQVNTYTDGSQDNPAIAMDERGRFVITWQSLVQDCPGSGIFAQRYNKFGKALGSEFHVNTYTDKSGQSPAIEMGKSGNFVITWMRWKQNDDRFEIFAQLFNKQGKALGSEFQVNTSTDYGQSHPAIAMDERGNFVITWTSYLQDGSATGIFGKMFIK